MSGIKTINRQSTNINNKLCRSRNLVEYYVETSQLPPTGHDIVNSLKRKEQEQKIETKELTCIQIPLWKYSSNHAFTGAIVNMPRIKDETKGRFKEWATETRININLWDITDSTRQVELLKFTMGITSCMHLITGNDIELVLDQIQTKLLVPDHKLSIRQPILSHYTTMKEYERACHYYIKRQLSGTKLTKKDLEQQFHSIYEAGLSRKTQTEMVLEKIAIEDLIQRYRDLEEILLKDLERRERNQTNKGGSRSENNKKYCSYHKTNSHNTADCNTKNKPNQNQPIKSHKYSEREREVPKN
ncbi:hypothetical protein NEIRO03_0850 [Nematocida sp. AWRm78]|nr:hypothetical protein NEIRO02_1115 [Nematocida sp. AWRm79]KAI5183235.1 hypothetical protein NEIRO03_0850 [Nematocida sp. AWRm78]